MERLILGIDPGTTNFAFALITEHQQIIYTRSLNICPRQQTYRAISIAVPRLLDAVYTLFPSLVHVCVEMQLREHMIAVMQSVATWAYLRNVSCEIVTASTWRKRIGLRSQGAYEKNKRQSVKYCQDTLGLQISDHNVAEAILICTGALKELVK